MNFGEFNQKTVEKSIINTNDEKLEPQKGSDLQPMDPWSSLKDAHRQTPDWVGTSACSYQLQLRIKKDVNP